MKPHRLFYLIAALLSALSLASMSRAALAAETDLFPTPVSATNTAFPALSNQAAVDDSALQVSFTQGFSFPFYGNSYSSVFLNSNGGLTFGSANPDWNPAATSITQPAIAAFWGDMHAGAAPTRSRQMRYEQLADRFVVYFDQIQDHDNSAWNNSATLTLLRDGSISIAYGTVGSEDILAGVFSGTHSNDTYVGVQGSYSNYAAAGSSLVLFDEYGLGPGHKGELNGRTLVFSGNGSAYPLTVSKTGSGRVDSTPAGIACGNTCSASFATGSTVSLSASAGSDSHFLGWSGACAGNSTCNLTMDSARNVGATFIDGGVPAPPTITAITPGAGRLTIQFTAPDYAGNSPITGYGASCSASGYAGGTATGSSSPLVVSTLTGNVPYVCTVTASNASGSSSASAGVSATPQRRYSGMGGTLLLLD